MSDSLININFGGLLFIQFILLILHYGNILMLPKWLVWLPAMIMGVILGIVLVILLVVFVVWLASEVF